jgi:pimeloyl-ACP methyl ester carboxylesterase
MPQVDALQLSHRSLTVSGLQTRLIEGGPSMCDEAVVFVHGNPGSAEDWTDLMQRLAPSCRVLAMDMPGFGHADKPADHAYSVESGASFLADLLDQVGVRRAHLVLHDFGGPWGMLWAAQHGAALASLSLINTGLLKGYTWHHMARIWRTPLLGELQQLLTNRSGFGWAIQIGCPRGLPKAFIDRMYQDLDWGTRRAILKLYRATNDLSGRSDTLGRMLAPLNPPTLVIWGAADPYLPVRHAEAQRDVFPQAEVHILPDSGHFPFADDPDGVAAALLPFMARQRQAVHPARGHAFSA